MVVKGVSIGELLAGPKVEVKYRIPPAVRQLVRRFALDHGLSENRAAVVLLTMGVQNGGAAGFGGWSSAGALDR